MTGLSNCKKFSELVDWVRANGLSEDGFYKLAEPTMQGLKRAGLFNMAVQYSEAHGFVLDLAETYRNRIDELFEE